MATAFSALYLATRTWAFSYDALTAALTAERNGKFPFHPNHLFGNGLGWLFYKGVSAVNGPTHAIFIFQTVNAVVAGIAVGYFFNLLATRFSLWVGILGAAGMGLSFAFWSEAVDAGAYASASFATFVLTGALLKLDTTRSPHEMTRPAFSIGLLVGLAILVHQMFILTIPSFLILLSFPKENSFQHRFRPPLFFLFGVLLSGVVPYALIAHSYYGYGFRDGLFWFFGPAGPRPNSGILVNSWWQWQFFQNIPSLWRGLVESIATPFSPRFEWIYRIWQGGLALGLIFIFFGSLRLFIRDPQRRPLLFAFFAWILAMNLFQFFWVPGIIRFRILFLPVLITCVFLAWDGVPELCQKWSKKIVTFFLCTIFGIGLSNGLEKIVPATHLERNRDIVRALWAQQTMGPNDFFLFAGSGDSITNVVPPYFAPGVRSRSLYGYFFANPQGDFSEIGQTIDQTLKNGGAVFIEEALFKKETWAGLAPNESATLQILSRWFSPYHAVALETGPAHYRVTKICRQTKAVSTSRGGK